VKLCSWKHGESAACGEKPSIKKEKPFQMLAAQFAAFPCLLPKAKQQAGLFAQTFSCTDAKVGSSKSLRKLCKREVPIALRQSMVTSFKSWMVCIYTFHLQMCALFSAGSGLHYPTEQAHCQLDSAKPGIAEHAPPCACAQSHVLRTGDSCQEGGGVPRAGEPRYRAGKLSLSGHPTITGAVNVPSTSLCVLCYGFRYQGAAYFLPTWGALTTLNQQVYHQASPSSLQANWHCMLTGSAKGLGILLCE
jgi:hypothetical protein